MGSSRLPGKIIFKLDKKKTVIQFLIERLLKSKNINKVIVATTTNKEDKFLKNILKNINVRFFMDQQKMFLKVLSC